MAVETSVNVLQQDLAEIDYRAKFKLLQVCVLIPTYNNETTLHAVISGVLKFTDDIIVVNDGSTDTTEKILSEFSNIKVISYADNVGKGWALRQGFREALDRGFRYVLTIDSDGQHFPHDIPLFIKRIEEFPDSVIMGSRNMDQASVPGKSSFGHKFSNFWFWVETGIKCPDTQTGYRLYPIRLLKGMKFITRKFEFEIEVIVRAAWRGIRFDSVPVTVYYAPREKRISHFRPFKDFTRISILNTFLVIISIAYIKPRNFFRFLFNKKKVVRLVNEHLFNPDQTDFNKSVSIGFGVFMGIIPVWGFQMATALGLAFLFRLNKALVIIAANISIPPMIPIIIYLSYRAGGLWMSDDVVQISFSRDISIESVKQNVVQYIYGSITLAVVAGVLSGSIAFGLMKLFKRKSEVTA